MKPIIAFDLDGTIIDSSAGDIAHKKWFSIVGDMLGDDSVLAIADKKDYFPDLLKVMERLTGLKSEDSFSKQVMVKYARNLFQMLYLHELQLKRKEILVEDMLDVIIDLKGKYRLALITTSPEDVVLPALDLVGLKNMFDFVYRSPLNMEPSKSDLMKKFVRDLGVPALYVGNELGDAKACKELGVKFALAKWGKFDAEASNMATYNLTSPKQLVGVVGLLR